MKKSIFIALLIIATFSCKTAENKTVVKNQEFEIKFDIESSLKDKFKTTMISKDASENSLVKIYTNSISGITSQKFSLEKNYFPTRIVINLGSEEKIVKINNVSLSYGDEVFQIENGTELTDLFALNKFVKYDNATKTLTISKEDKPKAQPLLTIKRKVLDSLR